MQHLKKIKRKADIDVDLEHQLRITFLFKYLLDSEFSAVLSPDRLSPETLTRNYCYTLDTVFSITAS
jgi:hypothetical protein